MTTPSGVRALARGKRPAADSLADSTGWAFDDAQFSIGVNAYPVIVPETNERVQAFLKLYTTSRRKTFQVWLNRSGPYFPLVARELQSAGLPIELACVVFIESGFNLGARSWAQAVGPWQFIASTARIFGLSVTRDIDERHDIERSSQAAAKMFSKLYDTFGSWPLSLAAYNCGDGCVGRAVQRQGTSDFWSLRLPNETQNYVSQFMAILLILRDPDAYGFTLPGSEPLVFREVTTSRRTQLRSLARRCAIEPAAVLGLNPAYKSGWVPKGETLRLPLAVTPETASLALAVDDSPPVKRATVRRGSRGRVRERERERSDAGSPASRGTTHGRTSAVVRGATSPAAGDLTAARSLPAKVLPTTR